MTSDRAEHVKNVNKVTIVVVEVGILELYCK